MRYSVAGLALLSSLSAAVDVVEVRGQDFVNTVTGDRFVVVGVDYQPGGQASFSATNTQDVLSNGTACLRDAALMQQLGVNVIRSYNVDPTLNHDECASIFNSVGIYMILDVNTPVYGQYIDRSNPSSTYTTGYLEHIFSMVEAFKSYPNTLGFFSGNEIINDMGTAMDNPPYMRAVVRDLKNYISNHADRAIPVGYSAADVRDFLQPTFEYLSCRSDDNASQSDFFGLNSYSWCGSESSFTTSGYDILADEFGNASIPVFFSEYGCNDPSPRVFDEVPSLYGPQMTALSGGLVYEWSQEDNNFGLVNIYSNGSAQLLPDFVALQGQYNKINVSSLMSRNDTATGLTAPECSADLITVQGFSNDFDLPSVPSGASAIIQSGITSAPTGQIVSVTQTAVALPVFDQNGASISSLAITPTSVAVPTGGTIGGTRTSGSSRPSGSSGGSSGGSASPTKTGAANRLSGAAALAVGAAMIAL